jgi:hypothetical protein
MLFQTFRPTWPKKVKNSYLGVTNKDLGNAGERWILTQLLGALHHFGLRGGALTARTH